ncbi:hypothetical protein [Rhizobium mongolense]|uniref:hypothetical protein n=1 Tax=Rhizobium mongolense TaxID=57676 RepID=UPI0034A33738
MAYQIELSAPLTRIATIQNKVKVSTTKREFYGFRNRKSELPLVQVPLALPVYRMENFRTFTDQHDYVTAEGKNANFFSAGQESETAQQAQHLLLARLAQKGKEGSVVPVIDVLRKHGQREPLLITATGVVVNGNRRLAAMRELYEEDGTAFASFSHVDVLVLPADATEDEILDVEANLQATPETKLDYDWIGELQLINRLVNLGRSHEQVANQLQRKEKEIKNAVLALAEADLYLKESGSEGSYGEIREDAEQLFKDLPKALDGKDERGKEASRAIAYSLFRNKEKLPSRIYDYNAGFGRLADKVLKRVGDELGIAESSEGELTAQTAEEEVYLDFGEATPDEDYRKVVDVLKDEANETAASALIEAVVTEIEIDKGTRSGEAALKAIGQAHTKLASVDLGKASDDTFPAIAKQLEAIRVIVAALESTLSKKMN